MDAILLPDPSPGRTGISKRLEAALPGVILVSVTTAAAYGLRQLPGFSTVSPMISAIFIGIVFANITSVPPAAKPGVSLLGKRMLRGAVALLGLQLSLTQVVEVGVLGMAVLAGLVFGTYGATVAIAKLLGVDIRLARLLAAGTAICGASAVAATNAVQNNSEEDVAYAVACITLFGTASMLLYPFGGDLMGLNALQYGFWTGASVHEVAQVVAAGFQHGAQSGEFSVVVKLSRVLMLAPLLVVIALNLTKLRAGGGGRLATSQIVPFFVAGFVVLMLINSAGLVPASIKGLIVQVTPIMLTGALGALGLGTSFGALREKGVRPVLLAAIATGLISVASLLALNLMP